MGKLVPRDSFVLSDGTIHGDIRWTGVGQKGLNFNAPSRLRCPRFRSNGDHGGIPEHTGEDGRRLEVHEDG